MPCVSLPAVELGEKMEKWVKFGQNSSLNPVMLLWCCESVFFFNSFAVILLCSSSVKGLVKSCAVYLSWVILIKILLKNRGVINFPF